MDAADALTLATKLDRRLANRRPLVEQRDNYYAGEQRLKYATEEWAKSHAERYRDFSDNWCGVVADSPAERVAVIGFRLDTDSAISRAESQLWSDWQRNDLDAISAQGWLEAFIASRSLALVWGSDDDEPLVTWEHPGQALVAYDPENPRRRVAGVKRWADDDFEYLTLYTPGEVWKWQQERVSTSGLILPAGVQVGGGSWAPRLVDDVWPLPNPLGVVPLVEFPNRPRLGAEPLSDIAGTMAMQDAINLLWAYLFNAADYASMPARVVMGQQPPKIPILDENGQKVGELPVDEKVLKEGRLLWLTGQNTTIGTFPAATLTAFTDVVEVAVGHVAAQTRTPQHYLIGKMANLSGDALKAAETGLVKKADEATLHFTAPVRELFRLMAMVRGDRGAADAARMGTVQWKDRESRSEAQLVDALSKLGQLGVPLRFLLERYGLSDAEVERVMRMREDEALADPALKLASSLISPESPNAAPSGD